MTQFRWLRRNLPHSYATYDTLQYRVVTVDSEGLYTYGDWEDVPITIE